MALKDWRQVAKEKKYIKFIKGKTIGEFTSDDEVIITFPSKTHTTYNVYIVKNGKDHTTNNFKTQQQALRYAKQYMRTH